MTISSSIVVTKSTKSAKNYKGLAKPNHAPVVLDSDSDSDSDSRKWSLSIEERQKIDETYVASVINGKTNDAAILANIRFVDDFFKAFRSDKNGAIKAKKKEDRDNIQRFIADHATEIENQTNITVRNINLIDTDCANIGNQILIQQAHSVSFTIVLKILQNMKLPEKYRELKQSYMNAIVG